MSREALEKHQVLFYLAAILVGLGAGSAAPGYAAAMETLVWPALAALLYATFTQVPLSRLPAAFRDRRFVTAVLAGNFIAVPILVFLLLPLVPDDPAVRLGVLLVLLVPCTDWFVTFTHLGGGATRRAIAVTPLNLLAQMALLPFYLWLFMGSGFFGAIALDHALLALALLIAFPLALAWATQLGAGRSGAVARTADRLAWLPVPLLALVLFMVAASQVEAVAGSGGVLVAVLPVFLAFVAGAVVLGLFLGRLARLDTRGTRALAFSLASRNSFVVLPFALALPASWELAAIVIVFQSLVELFALAALVWLMPRLPAGS